MHIKVLKTLFNIFFKILIINFNSNYWFIYFINLINNNIRILYTRFWIFCAHSRAKYVKIGSDSNRKFNSVSIRIRIFWFGPFFVKIVIFSRGGAENNNFQSRWFWKWTFSVEVVLKMNIFSQVGIENGQFQSRWYWKWTFPIEVVLKMNISSRVGTENGHFQSRCYWKLPFPVELVLKMNISSRGGTENEHFQSRWYWK